MEKLYYIPSHYTKIIKTINSCTNRDHLTGCSNMILTFEKIFENKNATQQLEKALNDKFLKILKDERAESKKEG